MIGIRILVWKKGTNKAISEPDYTIEIGGGDQYDILLNLVMALERIAKALENNQK